MNEQRTYQRTPINRSVVYVGLNHKDQAEVQGVALALDLSPKGMMLESTDPIHVHKLNIRSSTDEGDSVEISSQVIYSMLNSPGKYRTGVQFTGKEENIVRFVAEMMK
jgi:hypothetical protein